MEYCNICDKEIKGEVYEYNDECICESCYTGLADRAEYEYESYRENEEPENEYENPKK